jgi:hypothetical protein
MPTQETLPEAAEDRQLSRFRNHARGARAGDVMVESGAKGRFDIRVNNAKETGAGAAEFSGSAAPRAY